MFFHIKMMVIIKITFILPYNFDSITHMEMRQQIIENWWIEKMPFFSNPQIFHFGTIYKFKL